MQPALNFKQLNWWQTPDLFRVFPYERLCYEYQELNKLVYAGFSLLIPLFNSTQSLLLGNFDENGILP